MEYSLRLQLIGALAEKKETINKLENKAEGLRKHINVSLFSEDGIEGINFEEAKQEFEDLVITINEFKKVKTEIKKIENELGIK